MGKSKNINRNQKITVILSVAQRSRSIFSLENLNILSNKAFLNEKTTPLQKDFSVVPSSK
jgi:hypothetical protein